MKPMSEKMIFL